MMCPVTVANVHLCSVHYCCMTSVSSVAVGGNCCERVAMSTWQLSVSPVVVELSVVVVNDVYLLAVQFSHQSASID